jgi:hypothetical protein
MRLLESSKQVDTMMAIAHQTAGCRMFLSSVGGGPRQLPDDNKQVECHLTPHQATEQAELKAPSPGTPRLQRTGRLSDRVLGGREGARSVTDVLHAVVRDSMAAAYTNWVSRLRDFSVRKLHRGPC